ncbi:MAG: sugar transferase [Acidobacteria bacterium]|nr:sugar transferase [Acidobacteriota bacterium]
MSLRRRSVGKALRTGTALVGDCAVACLSVFVIVVARRMLELPLTRALLPPEKFPLTLDHLALWSFSLVLALALSGFYDTTASPRHRPSLFVALPLQLAILAVAGTVFEMAWPRSVFLTVPLLESLAIPGWRRLLGKLWPLRAPGTIAVGRPADLLDFADDILLNPRIPLEIAGLVSVAEPIDHPHFLGTLDEPKVREAVIAADEVIDLGGDEGVRRLLLLSLRGARGFLFVSHVRDGILAGSHFTVVGDRLLAEVRMPGSQGVGAAVKRVFDLVAGSLLLLLSLPLQLLVAAAVASERRGAVLLRQPRLGINGEVFDMWKFRTMDHEGEDLSRAVDGDHRVTPVGRWLRRYRLDELPQLVNVVTGDMSVVGPRPEIREIAEEIAQRVPYFELRLAMRPGIAGLAQVSAEYDQSPETKLTYDLQYLCSWSPLLDIRILVQALTIVLAGRGV